MQFKLTLRKENKTGALPVNYRYDFYKNISALIDRSIALQDVPFSSDFRNRVVSSFTFGLFDFDAYEIREQAQRVVHLGEDLSLEIRFLIEDQEEDFIQKALTNQQVLLGDTIYRIAAVKSVPPMDFQDVMDYRCMCPISLATHCPSSGSISFLSPRDQSFNDFLKVDLIKRLLRDHPEVSGLKDLGQYCPEFQFRLLSEPKKEGFHIQCDESCQSIVGYQFDFQLKASPVLHELGFYEGFGLTHSMGLGFVEVLA